MSSVDCHVEIVTTFLFNVEIIPRDPLFIDSKSIKRDTLLSDNCEYNYNNINKIMIVRSVQKPRSTIRDD